MQNVRKAALFSLIMNFGGSLFSLAQANPAYPQPPYFFGTDVKKGVICKINDVELFAKSAADCEKAGGKVVKK